MSQIEKKPSRPQGWLWTLVAFAFLSQTALNMARPQMSYKLLSLGASETIIGALTALYALVPVFLAIGLGRYTERVANLRYTTLSGGVLIGLGTALMALLPNMAGIALASMVLGFGHLIFTVASQASISRYSTDSGLDRGFGWLTAGISAGQLLGPLLGGLILGNSDGATRLQLINTALWLGAGFALLSMPLMLWPVRLKIMPQFTEEIPLVTAANQKVDLPQTAPRKNSAGQHPLNPDGRASTLKILQKPGVASNVLASMAMLSVVDILTSFLPLVGEKVGVSPAWVGLLLAARSAASIASRSSLTAMSRRWNRSQLVISSLLVSSLLIALIPLVLGHPVLSMLAMLVGGFFVGIAQPLTMTMIVKSVPTSWRSPALAVRLTGNRAGQVFIPLLAGALAAPLGPAGAIWFACSLIALAGSQKALTYARKGPSEADR